MAYKPGDWVTVRPEKLELWYRTFGVSASRGPFKITSYSYGWPTLGVALDDGPSDIYIPVDYLEECPSPEEIPSRELFDETSGDF